MTELRKMCDAGSRLGRAWQAVLPAGMLAAAMTLAGCTDSEPSASAGSEAPEANVEAALAADGAVVLTGDEAVAAVEAGEAQPYPLDVCLVSGAPVGSMGPEAPIVYNGQEIKFCCPGCDKLLIENPDDYLAKLKEGSFPGEAGAHDHADHEHDHGHDHQHDHEHG